MKQKIFVSILTLLLAGGTLTGFSAKSNISQNDATNGNVPQVINEAIFQQNGITQQTSYDGGDTWNAAPVIEMPEFYSYDEFEEWIKNETVNLQELVAAGEISQSEVNAIIAQYETILSEIKDGVQISKRTSYEEEQLYFSLPTKPATPMRKSGVAEQRKCRFPTLPCMRNGSFIRLISIFKTKKPSRAISRQERKSRRSCCLKQFALCRKKKGKLSCCTISRA